MFRLYVFTCCLQRIFYNRKKIPFPRFIFAGWKKSHLLEFFCWCKGKNPIFRVHRDDSEDDGEEAEHSLTNAMQAVITAIIIPPPSAIITPQIRQPSIHQPSPPRTPQN